MLFFSANSSKCEVELLSFSDGIVGSLLEERETPEPDLSPFHILLGVVLHGVDLDQLDEEGGHVLHLHLPLARPRLLGPHQHVFHIDTGIISDKYRVVLMEDHIGTLKGTLTSRLGYPSSQIRFQIRSKIRSQIRSKIMVGPWRGPCPASSVILPCFPRTAKPALLIEA